MPNFEASVSYIGKMDTDWVIWKPYLLHKGISKVIINSSEFSGLLGG